MKADIITGYPKIFKTIGRTCCQLQVVAQDVKNKERYVWHNGFHFALRNLNYLCRQN